MTERIREHNRQQGDLRTVVISHCFLDGGAACESERPLSVGGAEGVSAKHFQHFNYAALGHLHGAQNRKSKHIRYSGSILKYSFSEVQHQKSVSLVDMDAQGNCSVEMIPLRPLHDMRTVEGALSDILSGAKKDPHKEDYLQVCLTDTHVILDIMGKLREVYPNTLHIERPGLLSGNPAGLASRERLQKGELSMFRDFFEQVRGEKLNKAQTQLLKQTLKRLHQAE